MQALELLLDSNRGVHIPQDFVLNFDIKRFGLDSDSWEVKTCADPDNEHYWEAWQNILDLAEWHSEGKIWRLYQDGDLWLICYELMTDEEKHNFYLDL